MRHHLETTRYEDMTNDKSKKAPPPQPIDPQTLGWWAHSLRLASRWSQEAVAAQSGLNVRTIQRVEAGHPSSVQTRRALARGLGYDDLDVFNKHENAAHIESLRAEILRISDDAIRQAQFPGCIFIDATEAKSGKDLADFAEEISAWMPSFDDDTPQRAKELFCSLVDYITDYGETAELCCQTDKLGIHAQLDDLLSELNQEGYGFYYASRAMKLTNDAWKDKTPLRTTLGYMRLLPTGKSPVQLAVSKTGHRK
jgi:transcriptional regulator with XRE-family HTH domain